MAKINIRSPYHVHWTNTNLTSVKLELYVYTGTQTTSRGSIDYTINSTAFNDKVTFEISELVRDFLDIIFSGTYTSQMVWVDYQLTESISEVPQSPETIVLLEGFDGYGYFENAVNPQLASSLMQSNTIQYVKSGEVWNVPVSNDLADTVEFFDSGVLVKTETIVSSALSSGQIEYINTPAATEFYQDRVTADGGTFEGSTCLTVFLDSLGVDGLVDSIVITPLAGDDITITLIPTEECKHTPYKVTFVNKFGTLQDLWFFKRTDVSLETSKNSYKGNILTDGSYSVSEHQNKILNKQGQESLVLNSGFVDEQHDEVFRQFNLSEKVWIEFEGNTLPLEVTASQIGFKTQLNDKLINYTINCEFAFDKINSVR